MEGAETVAIKHYNYLSNNAPIKREGAETVAIKHYNYLSNNAPRKKGRCGNRSNKTL
jgi:hypothetical protein